MPARVEHLTVLSTYEWAQKARVSVLGRPFQPSLMFVIEVGAYRREAFFRCFTLGKSLGITHKHQIWLD